MEQYLSNLLKVGFETIDFVGPSLVYLEDLGYF